VDPSSSGNHKQIKRKKNRKEIKQKKGFVFCVVGLGPREVCVCYIRELKSLVKRIAKIGN
jgi:hypothetical protein